jgi:hypothetical protein
MPAAGRAPRVRQVRVCGVAGRGFARAGVVVGRPAPAHFGHHGDSLRVVVVALLAALAALAAAASSAAVSRAYLRWFVPESARPRRSVQARAGMGRGGRLFSRWRDSKAARDVAALRTAPPRARPNDLTVMQRLHRRLDTEARDGRSLSAPSRERASGSLLATCRRKVLPREVEGAEKSWVPQDQMAG